MNRKGEYLLTENLQSANLNVIKREMAKDEQLRKFLNTPAKDLPNNYHYLIQDVSTVEDSTLYDIIAFTCIKSIFKAFISYSGNKPVGFVAYLVGPYGVENIKMFSFIPETGGGTILLRDMSVLIEDLLHKYGLVEWVAYPGNPANKIYDKVIKQYNGKMKDFNGELRYSIESPYIDEETFTVIRKSTGEKYSVKARTLVEAKEKVKNILKIK